VLGCRDDPVTAPENTIAPGWRALLLAGVPRVCAGIVFVSWNKVQRHLIEAIESLALRAYKVELVAAIEGAEI
jgi:hypothetical protein